MENYNYDEEVILKNKIFFSTVGTLLLLILIVSFYDECVKYYLQYIRKKEQITVVDVV